MSIEYKIIYTSPNSFQLVKFSFGGYPETNKIKFFSFSSKFITIENGEGVLILGNEKYILKPKTTLLIPYDKQFTIYGSSQLKFTVLFSKPEYPNKNEVKSEMKRGLGSVELSFPEKAVGTILENNYDVLFNLFLVKNKARPSFLLESGNYDSGDTVAKIIKTIEDIYPEFIKTQESEFRWFYTIAPITPISPNEDHNAWVGKVLGFNCPGDLIRESTDDFYVLSAYLFNESNSFQFYVEICKNLTDELEISFGKKIQIWKELAKEFETDKSSFTVKGEIKKEISTETIYNNLINKNYNWLNEHTEEVNNLLERYYIELSESGSINFSNDWEKILESQKNWDYITFYAMINTFNLDPYILFYPLSADESKKWTARRIKYLKKYFNEKSPLEFEEEFSQSTLVKSLMETKKVTDEELDVYFEELQNIF